jgi:hypothetical protein
MLLGFLRPPELGSHGGRVIARPAAIVMGQGIFLQQHAWGISYQPLHIQADCLPGYRGPGFRAYSLVDGSGRVLQDVGDLVQKSGSQLTLYSLSSATKFQEQLYLQHMRSSRCL